MALVSLSRDCTIINLRRFLTKQRAIIPKVLALNGRAGWDSTIAALSPADTTPCSWDAALPELSVPLAVTNFFKCKLCNKVEPSTCKEFQICDLDRTKRCYHCKRGSSVKDWSCSCGIRWYLCPTHSKGSRVRTTSHHTQVQAERQAIVPRKRKAEKSETCFDSLLQEDVRIERKRKSTRSSASTITLGDSVLKARGPTILGPILTSRFGRR